MPQAQPEPLIEASVHELTDLRLEVVSRQDSAQCNEYINRYHYLGYKPLPGAQLRYFAYSGVRPVALLSFGAPAWKTGPRDEWIGWNRNERQRNLNGVVNNTRFLILPWVRIPSLGSKLLSMAARRLAGDWANLYDYRPVFLETFERPRVRFPRPTLRILHCRTETEAIQMREHMAARLRDCGLEMHPDKTRVVYCNDSNRTGSHENVQFDFLGYTFRPRFAQSRAGKRFATFSPAMSRLSATSIRQSVRGWRLSLKSDVSLEMLTTRYSPVIRGWIGYYCRFHRTAFGVVSKCIDAALVRWATSKFKLLRGHRKRATTWPANKRQQSPYLFPHWCPPQMTKAGTMGAR